MSYQHQPFDTDFFSADFIWNMTAWQRWYFRPRFFGLDKITPAQPALLVGNHTLYGVFDVPLLIAQIYHDRHILVRGLADHFHYAVPGWRTLLDRSGCVHGTPANCSRLMEAGEHVMVFPGGAREVCKRRGEQYQLVWKQRTGFCRLAIQHQYPIIPFAVVGPDDAYDIVLDARDVLDSRVGGWLAKSALFKREGVLRGGEFLPPLGRGIGPTALPRPEPFYIAFGDPIHTIEFSADQYSQFQLRDQVAASIQGLMSELLLYRERDHRPGTLRRLLTRL